MKITIVSLLLSLFLLGGCKENSIEPVEIGSAALEKWGVPKVVHDELIAVKAATAKYNDIKKALDDGYVDINVYVPGMGHHFLNFALLDDEFELTKPEILVYQLESNGKYKLVAVEYATPLSNPFPPEGFTGDLDHWDAVTGAGIWALHAWIWKYNPDGVFAPMNPDLL
jgi:hypothetical protein